MSTEQISIEAHSYLMSIIDGREEVNQQKIIACSAFLKMNSPDVWSKISEKIQAASTLTLESFRLNIESEAKRQTIETIKFFQTIQGMGTVKVDYEDFVPIAMELMIHKYTELKPPVVDNFIRRGEIMNIIASPKTGKSWFVLSLAIAIALDLKWLNHFSTVQGRVLIIDNELHEETLSFRLKMLLKSMGVTAEDIGDKIEIISLRGALKDINAISAFLYTIESGKYSLIIFDAWYRVLPSDVEENDNGAITQLYNQLDRLAIQTDSALVLVHHSSKGSQYGKSVTDMGSGAGSQSRAADTHLALRKHEEDNCVTLEAVTRSWQCPPPVVIQLDFPEWILRADLDPNALDKGGSKKNDKPCWNRQKFVDHYIHTEAFIDHDILLDQVKEDGIAIAEAERFLKAAIKRGDVLTTHKGKDLLYSRGDVTSPNANTGTDSTMTKKDQIIIYLKAFPEAINSDVAIKCDCSEKYVRTIRSELSKRST